jgi:acetylglutamate kinase
MLTKAKAVLAPLKVGLTRILILNGNQKNVLLDVLFNDKKLGTLCKNQHYLGADHDTYY